MGHTNVNYNPPCSEERNYGKYTNTTLKLYMLPLTDAHCHPTDDSDTLEAIASMQTQTLVCMSTSFHDIDLVKQIAAKFPQKVVPAYGYHPWFSHLVYLPDRPTDKYEHYRSVLCPSPPDEFIDQLPDPRPFQEYLDIMESNLSDNLYAIVGELGLDKAFRLPEPPLKPGQKGKLSEFRVSLDHQTQIFIRQLKLAIKLSRPISVHSVQTASLTFDTIQHVLADENVSLAETPTICLHSYSGSPEFLESNWFKAKHVKGKVFVSCSVLINISSQRKACNLAAVVPADRILVESDYHSAGPQMDAHTESGVSRLCSAYGWQDLTEAAVRLQANLSQFLDSQ